MVDKLSNKILITLLELYPKGMIGNRWSHEEITIVYNCKSHQMAKCLGLKKYGVDVKKTLDELIDEDFTSRTFDNVKAAL
jgi:hypothetical protein